MRLIAFAGISLRPADVLALHALAADSGVDLDVRDPIVRGNLVSILDTEPADVRVLILDGEFGQRLAVSVTEIREYLERGRYLAGGSSMGALRAVECRTLGMRSHGWVADQYRSRAVRADDEVALLFDPGSLEPVTVPLINVRWLAATLAEAGSLTAGDAYDMFQVAAGMHYRNRTVAALDRRARRDLPPAAATVLVDQLRPERMPAWDRKRLDAYEAVEAEIIELRGVDVG